MMKKTLACLLAVLQLVLLAPMTAQAARTETPVLNETIVGTMQFGTFSFASGVTLPDGKTHWDGGDYVKPFFYSDDYFAAPSYDAVPAERALTWRELPNAALVTASADLSLAAFGSNEHILDGDYSEYSRCAEAYLAKCGFTDLAVNNDPDPAAENSFNRFPSKDSIGVVLGKKQITVWNGRKNETCTLIAVGVRGGGYAGEWASNLTIGQSGRHLGFDRSAQKVLGTLRDYLRSQGITAKDHVKYWITGYSRGGAVANLAAGDIASAPNVYFAAKKDIYAYTFECPRAAVDAEDPDGTAFPCIHNILNRMDAVPRVSPAEFGNTRLGVDYYLPDHTNTDRIADYYTRMYRVLEALSPGYGGEIDTVVKNANPETYPYDRPVEIYNFSLQALVTDFNSKGLQPYRDWRGEPIGNKDGAGYSLYIDEFLDKFVTAFVSSRAWDYDPAHPTAAIQGTDPMTHRRNYGDPARGIEEGLRTLCAAALSKPGSSLGDAFSGIGSAIPSIILPAGQLLLKLLANYDLMPTEVGAQSMARDVESILKSILLQSEDFRAHEAEVNAAAAALSPVLTRLFLYDRMQTGSQYLGTLLKYAGDQIIVAHISELGEAWSESLDEDYVGRYRAITLPREADVKLVQFREGLDDALSFDGKGVLIAEAQDGRMLQQLDQRVTASAKGGVQTIRFPAYLDIRAEISLPDRAGTKALPLQLDGLQPAEDRTSWRTDYERNAANGNILPESIRLCEALTPAAEPGMEEISGADISLSVGETLLLTCGKTTSSIEGPTQGEFALSVRHNCPSRDFTDVDRSIGSWSHAAIDWAVLKRVTNGTSDTTFSPDKACTRAEAVTFLWRFAGRPEVKGVQNPFADVRDGLWYSDAVRWAVKEGITKGTSETTFSPDETCSRCQIVTLLWRMNGEPKAKEASGFADVAAGDYFASAVSWAVEEGITNGVEKTLFAPHGDCTRAHIVTFLYRFAE